VPARLPGFVVVEIEGAGIGEDAFVVKAQVHRVGAQPVAVAGRVAGCFAEQAQGAEGASPRPNCAASAVSKGCLAWRSSLRGRPAIRSPVR
jgi:hypothetical protein